ncbi:hypothetical protein NE237_024919 [Protea cynaroides]|uniref:GAG-pre-integrase domain-containing protein n=1 Tax=Protea cynaroides TaxID=273540 RepID=A0A9Q0H1G0_9MAGN|nr:hypothetical protein NE237_024919 [Protea cynaroides]
MFNGITRIISDIQHVPDLRKSLLSLGKFDDDGFRITLKNGRLKIIKGTVIVAKGELIGRLYKLIGDTMVGEAIVVNVVIESATIWHRRLRHMSMQGLKKDKETSSSDLPQMFQLKSLKEVQNQFEERLIDTEGNEASEEHTKPSAETQDDQGRPKRTANPPVWLKDYITAYAYIIEEHEPCLYREACEFSDASQGRASMEEEMEALYKNKTWDHVKLPNGQKAIDCKWAYKLKRDTNGNVE